MDLLTKDWAVLLCFGHMHTCVSHTPRVKGHVEFYLMGMSSQKDSKEALWWVCLVCVWQIPEILKERRLSIKI